MLAGQLEHALSPTVLLKVPVWHELQPPAAWATPVKPTSQEQDAMSVLPAGPTLPAGQPSQACMASSAAKLSVAHAAQGWSPAMALNSPASQARQGPPRAPE